MVEKTYRKDKENQVKKRPPSWRRKAVKPKARGSICGESWDKIQGQKRKGQKGAKVYAH
jgi:hypothetical protein